MPQAFEIDDLRRVVLRELTPVDAVGILVEVVQVDTELRDHLLLLVAELNLHATPGAVGKADEATIGRDELADFTGLQVHAFDVEDHAQVEPVDGGGLRGLDAHAGDERVGKDGLQALIRLQADIIGELRAHA